MDEYDVKVQNYKGSMDFYAYSFDFCAKGQISSVLEKKSQEYDGSSVGCPRPKSTKNTNFFTPSTKSHVW